MSRMNINNFHVSKKMNRVIEYYIKKYGYTSKHKIIQALFDEKTKQLYKEILEHQRKERHMLENNNMVCVDE